MTSLYTQASQMMHLKNQRLEAVSWYLHRERGCAFSDLSLSIPGLTRVDELLSETLLYRELPVYRLSWRLRYVPDDTDSHPFALREVYDCVQVWIDNPHLSHYNKHQENYGL